MKNRRVGLLTMGISLMSLGIILLLSQFSNINIVSIATKLWPIILIALGIEVLWANYKNEKEDRNIKVDFWSILIIMIILFVNVSMYGFLEMGIGDRITKDINASDYKIDLPMMNYKLDGDVKKIVIDGDRQNFKIRTMDIDEINMKGEMNIWASSLEEAESLVDENTFSIDERNNIIYIDVNRKAGHISDGIIEIPSKVDVEIIKVASLGLDIEDISKDVLIDKCDYVDILIKNEADLKISGNLKEDYNFKGNLKWDINGGDMDREYEDQKFYKGVITLGEAINNINILEAEEIKVNIIQ